MKKFSALLMALVLLLTCTACGGSGGKNKDRLEKIKEKGVLELCTEPYFAPYEFIDPSKTSIRASILRLPSTLQTSWAWS